MRDKNTYGDGVNIAPVIESHHEGRVKRANRIIHKIQEMTCKESSIDTIISDFKELTQIVGVGSSGGKVVQALEELKNARWENND